MSESEMDWEAYDDAEGTIQEIGADLIETEAERLYKTEGWIIKTADWGRVEDDKDTNDFIEIIDRNSEQSSLDTRVRNHAIRSVCGTLKEYSSDSERDKGEIKERIKSGRIAVELMKKYNIK